MQQAPTNFCIKKYSKTKSMLVVVVFIAMVTPSLTTANVIDDLKFWEEKPLQNVGFSDLYPKPLYKKSYIGWTILGTTVVAAGVFSYVTAGPGAPIAAMGVSSVASWIAGGGPGSYMAGLSIVGSTVGGNAMVGAAILNGLSIGLIGGGAASFTTRSAARKFDRMATVTATILDGVSIFRDPDTGQLDYDTKLILPEDLGSDKVIKLVKEIIENKEKRIEAITKGEAETASRYQKLIEINMDHAESMLVKLLESNPKISRPVQEDLLVLSVVAYENRNFDLFEKGLKEFKHLSRGVLDDYGYLLYLEAINYLHSGQVITALGTLELSIRQNPYAIEPIILYVNLLGDDLYKNVQQILEKIYFAEENYNSNKYSSPYSLLALYFRVATIYYNNQECVKAKQYFEKAKNKIDFIKGLFPSSDYLENQIELGIANSYYCMANKKKAWEIFHEITKSMKSVEFTTIRQQFAGYNN